MSLLSSIICSLGFLVIVFGLFFALITDAPISFPTLFICSLVEVRRSSTKSHGLFFPIFIHRILLDLGLEDFPASELVHIITPMVPSFLGKGLLS